MYLKFATRSKIITPKTITRIRHCFIFTCLDFTFGRLVSRLLVTVDNNPANPAVARWIKQVIWSVCGSTKYNVELMRIFPLAKPTFFRNKKKTTLASRMGSRKIVLNLFVVLADKIITAPNLNFAPTYDIQHEEETLQKLKLPVRIKTSEQKWLEKGLT